jgi:hypothetical protein
MTRKEHWEKLSDANWNRMAEDWLTDNIQKPIDLLNDDYQSSKISLIVSEMTFDASAEKQWHFILLTTAMAETDWQLGQIGAGLLEHILGWQKKWDGKDYIELIEQEAKTNGKLNRALLTVYKYMMTDEVWARVLNLKEQIKSGHLPLYEVK